MFHGSARFPSTVPKVSIADPVKTPGDGERAEKRIIRLLNMRVSRCTEATTPSALAALSHQEKLDVSFASDPLSQQLQEMLVNGSAQSTGEIPASGDALDPSQGRSTTEPRICGGCNRALFKHLLDGNFSPRTGVGFVRPRAIVHYVCMGQAYQSYAKSGVGVVRVLCGRMVTDVAPKASYEVEDWS